MFKDILFKYKIPFTLFIISILLFLVGTSINYLSNTNKNSIIFTTNEATNSSNLTKMITVDIEGEVVDPGMYSLPSDSRIQDLIDKSGGFTQEADSNWISKSLNKAQKLNDSDKVYIPSMKEESLSQNTNSSVGVKQLLNSGKININTASKKELESLAGIGDKTSEKIISGRPYNATSDLLDKKVLGSATFEKIKDLISTL